MEKKAKEVIQRERHWVCSMDESLLDVVESIYTCNRMYSDVIASNGESGCEHTDAIFKRLGQDRIAQVDFRNLYGAIGDFTIAVSGKYLSALLTNEEVKVWETLPNPAVSLSGHDKLNG